MKLSIYTSVQNGIYLDYHVCAMLKHHLPLADEIIVNEGMSNDGTFESIKDISDKIKIYRHVWDRSDPLTWHIKFKNTARKLCSGDWCILLDSDEFIPEWEFERLRTTLETTEKAMLPVRFVHFYGNYRVCKVRHEHIKHTPILGMRIHRNLSSIEVWGDGANVRMQSVPYTLPLAEEAFECHHFGEVRHPARLRQKWRTQAKQHNSKKPRWDWIPGFVFNWFPHDWHDPDFLADLDVYDGPLIQAVQSDPNEFVRDKFVLLDLLQKRRAKQRG